MLFLLLLLPYLKDFLDFRSETTYISTVVIYFNHGGGEGGRGGEVKGVDVKNHTALVTFILIHRTKSPDENRAILHFRRSFEKGGFWNKTSNILPKKLKNEMSDPPHPP